MREVELRYFLVRICPPSAFIDVDVSQHSLDGLTPLERTDLDLGKEELISSRL